MSDIPDVDGPSTDVDDSGIFGSAPVSGSQAAVILAIVVVVALLVWRFRSTSDGDDGGGHEEIEEALEADLSGEVTVNDDEDGDDIEIPANPDDELEKDAAVLDALKAKGKMSAEG